MKARGGLVWENIRRTSEQRAAIPLAAKGSCALCEDLATAVDHNHRTGKFRGFLCRKCNRGLSILEEDPGYIKIEGGKNVRAAWFSWREKALAYLEKGK